MAQAVSRRPLIAEARVRFCVSPRWICGGQSGTGTGLFPSLSVSPVIIFPPWISILMYCLGDVAGRSSETVSSHRQEHGSDLTLKTEYDLQVPENKGLRE
jgi:hypothetical protein